MAQVISPNVQPKDDALATIMKGLSIASSVYGIRANMAQLDEYQKKQAHEQDLAVGKYNKHEQLQLSEKFNISPTAPESGTFLSGTDIASGSPLYFSMKKAKPEKVEYVAQNGNKVIEFVDPKEGKSFTSFEQDRTPAKVDTIDAQGNPVIALVPNKPGQVFAAQSKDQKPTKEQFDAAEYGKRIQTANDVFEKLVGEGYNRASNMESIKAFILPEAAKSSELKQQNQAERNFVNAILRRQSGATISEQEFANAREQYFPRAGDSEEVLAQKAQNRQQELEAMKAAAGSAWAQMNAPKIENPKYNASGEAFAAPAANKTQRSPLDLLKIKASQGDKKAQDYLNSLKGQ